MENLDDNNIFLIEDKLPKGNPFSTPDGYFLSLGTHIESRIAIHDIEDKTNPFDLPFDYFKNLTRHIENRIYWKDLEKEIRDEFFENQKEDILNSILLNEKAGNVIPFEAPEGYFENLVSTIEAQTSLKQKPELRKLVPLRWAYAAAAAILLSIGIIYFTYNRPVESIAVTNFNTDSLSTAEIVNKLEKSDIPEEELIREIDVKQLTMLAKDQIQLDEKDLNKIINEIDENELTKDM